MAGAPTHNDKGQRLCGARARNSPTKFCRSTALGPTGRCRMHNGWARSGPLHPSWKDGRYGGGKYRQAISAFYRDPTALEHRRDAAIINARLEEQLEAVGCRRPTIADFRAVWDEFQAAAKVKDRARVQRAADEIDRLIAEGQDAERGWREIERLALTKAELIEKETRRIEKAAQMIPADQAIALVIALEEAVKDQVQDVTVRRAIGDAIARLVPRVH